jgi:phospholipid-binding lipoprotein MlaA
LTDLARYAPHEYRSRVNNTIVGVRAVGTRADLLPLDATLAAAFDPYAVVRDSYLQHREFLVRDGHVPEEPLEEPPPDETPPQEASPAPKPEEKPPEDKK